MKFRRIVLAVLVAVSCATKVEADQVQVQVENLAQSDGFFFTPVWVGFHDGNFDLFNSGSAASAGLELLAEEGDASVLSSEFAGAGTDGVVFSPGGFTGAPVFDPGETASDIFDINPNERYLSFASMLIPSNDAFFGNGDPLAYELFDADGNFNGPIVIEIFGSDIYDAGTEVNDGEGAAFSAAGGTSSDEGGVVALHPGLENFIGTATAAGTTIGSTPGAGQLVARITVTATAIPEPATTTLLALAGLVSALRRRR